MTIDRQKKAKQRRIGRIILAVGLIIILPFAIYVLQLMRDVSSVSANLAIDGLHYRSLVAQARKTRPNSIISKIRPNASISASFILKEDIVKPPKTTFSSIVRLERIRLGAFSSAERDSYLMTISGISSRKLDEFELSSGRLRVKKYYIEGRKYYDAYPKNWFSIVTHEPTPREDPLTRKGFWIGPNSVRTYTADWIVLDPTPDYQLDYFKEGKWAASFIYFDDLVISKAMSIEVFYEGRSVFKGLVNQPDRN